MKIVLYLRTRPDEPAASETAVAAQRAAAASWIADHEAIVIAEFTQPESDDRRLRELFKAVDLCREQDATLLIAMTDPIGSGSSFGPHIENGGVRCASITHGVPEPSPPRPSQAAEAGPPALIPLPTGAPALLCLHFVKSGPGWPVYLCNPGPHALTDITVTSAGNTGQWTQPSALGDDDEHHSLDVPVQTSAAHETCRALAPDTCTFVGRYDPYFDGDFITDYEVAYSREDDSRHQERFSIGKGGPSGRWVGVDKRSARWKAFFEKWRGRPAPDGRGNSDR